MYNVLNLAKKGFNLLLLQPYMNFDIRLYITRDRRISH